MSFNRMFKYKISQLEFDKENQVVNGLEILSQVAEMHNDSKIITKIVTNNRSYENMPMIATFTMGSFAKRIDFKFAESEERRANDNHKKRQCAK
jgi:hypothetical protein